MLDLSDFEKLLDNLDRLTDKQKAILLSRLSGEDITLFFAAANG